MQCLEVHPVAILDPDNGQVLGHYKAINITRMLAAEDLASLPGEEPLFRLAGSASAILVHGRVREALLARGFTDLAFYRTDEVAF